MAALMGEVSIYSVRALPFLLPKKDERKFSNGKQIPLSTTSERPVCSVPLQPRGFEYRTGKPKPGTVR